MTTHRLIILGVALSIAFSAMAGAQSVACVEGPTGTQCFPLLAGQTIPVGTVCVSVDGPNLCVVFTTTGGWELEDAYLWIGGNALDYPKTAKGNPIPGQFPWKADEMLPATNAYPFCIPLTHPNIDFSCPLPAPKTSRPYWMLAQAVVRNDVLPGGPFSESAWSNGCGPVVERGNWATFSCFDLTCCLLEGGLLTETAFAKSEAMGEAECFLNLGINANRWGWTNGPIDSGNYVWPIYAGASQCNTASGMLVGQLMVDYDGIANTVTLTYLMMQGYSLLETQAYVGTGIVPLTKQGQPTVAPGQYPSKHEGLGGVALDVHSFDNVTGMVYVLAHAVVAGF